MKQLLLSIFSIAVLAGEVSAQCAVTSAPTNNCSYGDAIDSFVLNGVATGGNFGCNSNGYISYTTPVRTLTLGGVYAWSTTNGGGSYPQGVAIWIDLNNDGFYTASEQVAASGSANTVNSGTLQIPYSATVANNIKMRVRCAYYTTISASDMCTNNIGSYGETEDYLINIVCPGAPPVTIAPSNTYICQGETTTLTASGAQVYSWTGGVTNGVGFTPNSTTTYTVTGSILGCPSSSGTAVRTISVTNVPLLLQTVSSPTVICAGDASTLTAAGATNFTWSPGNLTGSSIIVSPTAPIVYTVVGYNGSGCPGTKTLSMAVNPIPTITAVGTKSNVCEGGSVTFTASGAQGYTWTPGNVQSSTISVSPQVSSAYQVQGINSFGCFGKTSTVVIVSPAPNINAVANKYYICSGSSSTLTASGTDSYSWTGGGSGNTNVVNPTASTSYSVTGTNTTTGCTKTAVVNIAVFAPSVTVSSNTSVCMGTSLTISASGANAYTWTPGNLDAIQLIMPATTTMYSVTASTFSNGLKCMSSGSVQVTVLPNPTVTAVATKTAFCKFETTTITASGANSYVWTSSSATGSVITLTPNAANSMFVGVTGTDANNCKTTTAVALKVSNCTGINEFASSGSSIQVYPNPNNGTFTIRAENDVMLNLVNQLGQQVMSVTVNAGNPVQLSADHLPNGIYFLTGGNGNNKINQKVIIQK